MMIGTMRTMALIVIFLSVGSVSFSDETDIGSDYLLDDSLGGTSGDLYGKGDDYREVGDFRQSETYRNIDQDSIDDYNQDHQGDVDRDAENDSIGDDDSGDTDRVLENE